MSSAAHQDGTLRRLMRLPTLRAVRGDDVTRQSVSLLCSNHAMNDASASCALRIASRIHCVFPAPGAQPISAIPTPCLVRFYQDAA